MTLIPPTRDITHTGEELTIDGVRIVFQMTPGTEAPAEMNFYFPEFHALCAAENTSHTLHNVLTIRGAVVRDTHAWAHYLTETIDLWGDDARRGVRVAPLADVGTRACGRVPVRCSATCTSTSTIRPCGS